MFHERYRQKLVKEFVTIKELSGQYGAYATYLSGAGPTVMTLTPNDQAEALKTAIDGIGLDGETLIPVSYTHLDVYKRQCVPLFGRCL